ncbi:unnamed protein product [Prorocentrum cordatum]|uniref:Uncharacterized protein n=1 Tax=Prorocentrum cordatum TaxID=2364126 RepID=A0ABN9WNF9_9DINO|nr:unnamed protein product [Polarella glacialis]
MLRDWAQTGFLLRLQVGRLVAQVIAPFESLEQLSIGLSGVRLDFDRPHRALPRLGIFDRIPDHVPEVGAEPACSLAAPGSAEAMSADHRGTVNAYSQRGRSAAQDLQKARAVPCMALAYMAVLAQEAEAPADSP